MAPAIDDLMAEAGDVVRIQDDYVPGKWVKGAVADPGDAVGLYERKTFLGIRTDYWDGKVWRRGPRTLKAGGVYAHQDLGIVCANQDLDWREVRCV